MHNPTSQRPAVDGIDKVAELLNTVIGGLAGGPRRTEGVYVAIPAPVRDGPRCRRRRIRAAGLLHQRMFAIDEALIHAQSQAPARPSVVNGRRPRAGASLPEA